MLSHSMLENSVVCVLLPSVTDH